jgi:hypothetical protein
VEAATVGAMFRPSRRGWYRHIRRIARFRMGLVLRAQQNQIRYLARMQARAFDQTAKRSHFNREPESVTARLGIPFDLAVTLQGKGDAPA